jgi:SAM-dependent methyltransferase
MQGNQGYCHCCRKEVFFVIHGDWLRDQYICDHCTSIPRQRHLQYVLDKHFEGWESHAIHESSPSCDFIPRYATNYTSSQFLPEIPFGQTSDDGIRSENLEALTFASKSIDIFVTQDVFEHIFFPDRAAKEIARILTPGGIHIFTAPKFEKLAKSYPRSLLDSNGTITHLFPPEYHGNPVGDGRALVTWHFGDDFEYLLSEWSGLPVTTYVTRDKELGIDAKFNEVFVMRKPGN